MCDSIFLSCEERLEIENHFVYSITEHNVLRACRKINIAVAGKMNAVKFRFFIKLFQFEKEDL